MASPLPTHSFEKEGEKESNETSETIERKSGAIEEWINSKFSNLTNDIKLKFKQKLFEYNIKYQNDLILLQGCDDKIDDTCDFCEFDRKTVRIFSFEVSNINKNNVIEK